VAERTGDQPTAPHSLEEEEEEEEEVVVVVGGGAVTGGGMSEEASLTNKKSGATNSCKQNKGCHVLSKAEGSIPLGFAVLHLHLCFFCCFCLFFLSPV